ncbi:uncharacterized protein J4E79_005873 [Alternaria viburni]|uniref:uncharacterized protein n=1 Tax=Alternaria viburni TaxID=566460 RepID=UPI0020C22147|nr:uncharacterized protein J4E79_005873 [Alternaria viburni]KAI4660070.1 hypothetical protein J4E79_005873 [Alternaria viburni]
MSQQTHRVSDTKDKKDTVPEVTSNDEEVCDEEGSDDEFLELDILPLPKYGGTTWNKDDRGYENIRRPSMFPNSASKTPASFETVIETLERQLQEKQDARRSELEGEEVPEDQIEAKLKAEFGEPRKELQRKRDSLRRG